MTDVESWDIPCWHLVHTRPKEEARAECNLRTLNIRTYVPMYQAKKRNSFTGAMSFVTKPLFPRYVFAQFKIKDLYHKVCFTRGVQELVSFNNSPAAVDESVIQMIRDREEKNGLVNLREELKPGDRVIIQDGPFAKLGAVFERTTSDSDRVSLLLQTVGYQARILVDRDVVSKVAPGEGGPF